MFGKMKLCCNRCLYVSVLVFAWLIRLATDDLHTFSSRYCDLLSGTGYKNVHFGKHPTHHWQTTGENSEPISYTNVHRIYIFRKYLNSNHVTRMRAAADKAEPLSVIFRINIYLKQTRISKKTFLFLCFGVHFKCNIFIETLRFIIVQLHDNHSRNVDNNCVQ